MPVFFSFLFISSSSSSLTRCIEYCTCALGLLWVYVAACHFFLVCKQRGVEVLALKQQAFMRIMVQLQSPHERHQSPANNSVCL